MNGRFVCLMHHNVTRSRPGQAPPAASRIDDELSAGPNVATLSPSITSYFTAEDDFAAQMSWLAASRCVLRVDDLPRFLNPPSMAAAPGDSTAMAHSATAPHRPTTAQAASDAPPAVLLTFDDGWAGTFEVAGPILARFGLQAVVFVTTGLIGQPMFATAEQLRTADPEVFVLGSHTATHPFLNELPHAAIRQELFDSRRTLEDLLGRPVDMLSIPNGAVDERVRALAVEAGYTYVFTSRIQLNDARSSPRDIGRIAVQRSTPLAEFQRWASGDVRSAAWRQRLREIPRRLVGPRGYRWARARLLGQQSGQWEMSDLVARASRGACSSVPAAASVSAPSCAAGSQEPASHA